MLSKEQASHTGLWASLLFVLPFVWEVLIEPRLIFAEHLQPLEKAFTEVRQQTNDNAVASKQIRVALLEMRIESYQDRIRTLETTKQEGSLSSSDYLRMNTYVDKVDKLKRKLAREVN